MVARGVLGGVLLTLLAACGHPRDVTLLSKFESKREELERLVAMFQRDRGLGRVGDGFTRPEDPKTVSVSDERIAEYRRLCRAVGAPDCIEGYDATYERLYGPQQHFGEDKDPIWIHVSSSGLAVSGSAKGFMFSSNPSFPVVADLDAVRPSKSGTWLRHIEGHWYLYYDYED